FRKVAVLAVGALFAGTLSACGTDDAPTATEGDGTISGTVSLLTPIFEGSSGKTLLEDELLPQFYEEYPDVEVNIDYTAYSRLNEKMTTSIASGLVPDVMIMGVGWVEGFAENGVLADLGEYGITAEGLAETTNDRVVEAGIYKDNLYAVPIMLDARMGVARMDILEEAGYDAPPSTIEELREMSIALTERDAGGQMTRAGFRAMATTTVAAVVVRTRTPRGIHRNRRRVICGLPSPSIQNRSSSVWLLSTSRRSRQHCGRNPPVKMLSRPVGAGDGDT
ncbi:MAG: ABC transporter substrate-binding protein, partial [Arachnia sp.]